MADLAACYFCGGSAGVEARPVVPDALGEDPATVALCPDCAAKWERAMERVLAAAERGSDASSEAAGPAPPTAHGPSGPAEDRPDGPSPVGPEPVTIDESPAVASEREPAAAEDDPDAASDGDDGAGDRSPPAAPSDDASSSPTDVDPEATDAAAAGEPSHTGGAGRSGVAGDHPATETGVNEPRVTDPFDEGRVMSPSRRAADRVVRLLQNREFPIEEREFVDVAANAYELDPAEVRGVIELAIDRGDLEREGTALHRVGRADADEEAATEAEDVATDDNDT